MPWVQDEPLSLDARAEVLLGMRGRFDLGLDFTFGIFVGGEGRFIGGTGLHPRVGPDALEIGYWIDRDWQGRGLVSEAVQALCAVAVKFMGARRVEIRCAPTNARSRAIPERLGFHLDGTLREAGMSGIGEVEDRMIWTLLASECSEDRLSIARRPKLFDVLGTTLTFDGSGESKHLPG